MKSRISLRVDRTLTCALCTFAMLCAPACGRSEAAGGEKHSGSALSAKPAVLVTVAKEGTAKQRLRLPGTLEAWESARLFAKVTGYVKEIGVDIGDEVKKGQVLARLSVPETAAEQRKASADVPAASAQIEKAKADADLAKVTHDRLVKLRDREPGAISGQELDVALAKKKAADAQVKALESGLDVARAKVSEIGTMLTYSSIKAPFSGVVTARHADIGALVTQNAAKPLLEIGQMDKLRLVLEVPESVVVHVKLGQKVGFSLDALPGKTFEGKVARMAGALRPDTRSMRVEVDVDNPGHELSAGMYAKVDLGFRDLSGAIPLPATAIRSVEGEFFVFVVADGDIVRKVVVKILMDDGAEVVVSGTGLASGARVVLTAPAELAEGDAVTVKAEPFAQGKK